jgi:hypothetical protein
MKLLFIITTLFLLTSCASFEVDTNNPDTFIVIKYPRETSCYSKPDDSSTSHIIPCWVHTHYPHEPK